MKKGLKILLIFVLFFAVAVFVRLYIFKPAAKDMSFRRGPAAAETVTVKTVRAARGDIRFVLSYIGNLKARDEVNVYSKVTGKLVQYTVEEGDFVTKGQTIALVDRDETGLQYELAKVESPLDGILGRAFLDKGAHVMPRVAAASGQALAVIVNMSEMIVTLNIAESDIPSIKKGLSARVSVDAYPQDIFEGKITKVSEVVDPQTRTLPIEITLPNADYRLKSGMFGRIEIIASTRENVIVAPLDALIQEAGAKYVFIVQAGKAQKKEISLGLQEDGHVEISEGLGEGQEVIVFGQQGLQGGASVQAVSDE
ncbi:MAG: efflux RND transporter periplasmic adaptor subunit [Candidatus Omnitrophica bacterium]|nr:efflux RND transporter periplasmic adaptor subunit [Candidatus Omnitrophota bacterium]